MTAHSAHPKDHAHTSTSPMRRLLDLLRSERRDVAIVVAFAIGVGVLTLATPVAVQALVQTVAFGSLVLPLIVLGILLFAFLMLAGVIRAFKTYVVEILQRRLFVRVVTDLSQRLPRVHVSAFDRQHGPELVNRFFDVLTVQKTGAALLLDGVGIVLQALIGLLILAFYHPLLLAFDVVLILLIAFVLFVLGRGAVRTAISESKAKYAVAASLEEIARNPLTFKQFGGPAFVAARADALAVEYVLARRHHFAVVFRQVIGALFLWALASTALLTIGGWLVIEGQLTLGQLVASELIVSIVLASVAKFGKQLESFYDLLAAVDKLGQLIDLPLEADGGERHDHGERGTTIALRDVGFRYHENRPLLESLNLTLGPGDRVLIVGGHGSGRSTLADLLYGIRRPTRGRIELNGADYREISLDEIRRRIAVVKGLEIIEGDVEENVRLGRESVTPTAVREALAAVGILDELRDLPDGLATRLASTGSPLSYGLARRLMLARAIAGRPHVLVIDDLLDELDAPAREHVLAALCAVDRPWALVVLSRGEFGRERFGRIVRLDDGAPGAGIRPDQLTGAGKESIRP